MTEACPMKLPLYVYSIPSRHGKPRLYFWRGEGHKRVRIHEKRDTPEFRLRCADLLKQSELGTFKNAPRDAPKEQTLRWLWLKFSASEGYRKKTNEHTRHVTRLEVERMLREPIAPNDERLFADFPLSDFTDNEVEVLMARVADRPEAANKRLRHLGAMCRYGVGKGWLTRDPTIGVEKEPPKRTGGWPPLTPQDIEKFEARHPIGTKAHLATGAVSISRRSPQRRGEARPAACAGQRHQVSDD